MNYFLCLAAFSFLLLTSCQSKKKEVSSAPTDFPVVETAINQDSCQNKNGIYIKRAHTYNNFIVQNQGAILEENIRFIEAVKGNTSKENIATLYDDLENQTQEALDSLHRLCSFNGNEDYKNASIKLFKFYKNVWPDYKKLLKADTKEERIRILDKIKVRFNDHHSLKEKELEDDFNKAHTDFVNQYTLHVRSTPLHEQLDSLLYLQANAR